MSSPSAPTPTGTLEPYDVFPGIANGAIDRVFVHHTIVSHTLATVDSFDRGMRRMSRQYGNRYVMLFISNLSRATSPPEEVRSRFVSSLRNTAILPTTGAMAILSTGLIGATGRGIVTGVLLAVRLPFLVKVFGSVPEAYQFVAKEGARDGLTIPNLSSVETAIFELGRRGEKALREAPSGK